MTLARIAVLAGIALGILAANVVVSILYMVVYGHVIDPGHEKAYYEAHIKVAAPYCSIIAGLPLMFFAGWWVGGFWEGQLGSKPALVVWTSYAVIDLAIAAASGVTGRMWILIAVSLVTKLAAVYVGALVAGRQG